MSEYGIYLSYNNQEVVRRLPVNPESIEVREKGQGQTYDITALGEINVIKNPKLTEISFESIFPATWYPFVVGRTLLEPFEYVDTIKGWMKTKRPIRFTFTGSTIDINMAVSIEQFDWKEVAGSPGDIEYKIALKKYVFYAAKKVVVVQSSPNQTVLQTQTPPRPIEKETPKTYTLLSGDTLWKVSKKVLGDGSRWKEIQTLNNITDAQLKSLAVGMVLKLPTGGSNYA